MTPTHNAAQDSDTAAPRIMREHEVKRITGLARSTRNDLVARGDFPIPVDLGSPRLRGWFSDEIYSWLESRRAARTCSDPSTKNEVA